MIRLPGQPLTDVTHDPDQDAVEQARQDTDRKDAASPTVSRYERLAWVSRPNRATLGALIAEATVDCYNDSERFRVTSGLDR